MDVFSFAISELPRDVKRLLEYAGVALDDIDKYAFHQANKYMMNYLRKLIEIEPEKFYFFIENVGNTVSSTIPIALCEAQKEGKLKGNILIAGFGVGYSWGATVLKCSR